MWIRREYIRTWHYGPFDSEAFFLKRRLPRSGQAGHETCIRLPREISMAKAKSEKNQSTDGPITSDTVEPMVIALAEQLGTFLGRVQAKAEGWLENDTLREQVGQIRDGATNLLNRVNSASAAARQSVANAMPAAKKSAAKPKAQASKGRSGGTVDAPGKRHRKPPPQESINKRMGERVGKQAGQKQFKTGKSRGRG